MVGDFPVFNYSGKATRFFILSQDVNESLGTNIWDQSFIPITARVPVSLKDTDTLASSPDYLVNINMRLLSYSPHPLLGKKTEHSSLVSLSDPPA